MDKNQFYSTPLEELRFVPIDIETTGLLDSDEIVSAVVGSGYDRKATAFIQSNGEATEWWTSTDSVSLVGDSRGKSVETWKHSSPVVTLEFSRGAFDAEVHVVEDQETILTGITSALNSKQATDSSPQVLTTFNGDHWNGGFDVPFIRTACLGNPDVEFPFSGFAHVDLYPLFAKRGLFNLTHTPDDPNLDRLFNKGPLKKFASYLGLDVGGTKAEILETVTESDAYTRGKLEEYCEQEGIDVPTTSPTDLVSIYNRLAEQMGSDPLWDANSLDPFGDDESEKVVSAYEDGDLEDILLHNLADVARTKALATAAKSVGGVPKGDLKPSFY